jgi:hypothetical protein
VSVRECGGKMRNGRVHVSLCVSAGQYVQDAVFQDQPLALPSARTQVRPLPLSQSILSFIHRSHALGDGGP